MTYTYTDPYRCDLTISHSVADRCDVELKAQQAVDVPAADLPKIVAEIYKAAGVPAPIVHEHTDDEDQTLSIVSSQFRLSTAFVESCNGVYVTPEDLPGVVRKLYEAAGQEPPILLPRLNWRGDDRTVFSYNGVYVTRSGKAISLLGRTWDATTARGVARVLAEMADAADEELDPALLEPLAKLIDDVGDLSPMEIATALLRAGYARGEA